MDSILQKIYYTQDITEKSRHYHDCYQLILVMDGEVDVYINNVIHRVCAGDLVIISRYENHAVRVLSDHSSRYVVHIDPMAGQQDRVYAFLSDRPRGFRNIIPMGEYLPRAAEWMEQLIRETQQENPMAKQMIHFLLGQLMVMICRSMPDIWLYADEEELDFTLEIKRRLEMEHAQNWQLETLAREYGISVSGLCHRFKKLTGYAVMEYLTDCRIASAKKYLSQTVMPIHQIVDCCGFSDCSNFSRLFKHRVGITPTAFRKKYRRETS